MAKMAIIMVALIVGVCHPTFTLKIEGRKGRTALGLPLFIATAIVAIAGGPVGAAFIAELAGRILAGFLSSRK